MTNLRIPGPTPCPDFVLKEMSRQMINHRGPEFAQILNDVTGNLKKIFRTKNDVITLTASGTGGLEAAVVNMLSPGDKVLVISIGVFGDRFASIARTYGAEVIPLNFEWGKAADVKEIRKVLDNNPAVKAVLVTHNETSTGVTNDLEAISKVVKEFDKLLLIDAVSSMSSINLPVDDWNCDVVVSGSQKGWMVPPGLTMLSVSEKAWQANTQAKMPRFYFDIAKAKSNLEKGQTPWTPAISVVFAMDKALKIMIEEGLENIFARHIRIANMTRQGVKALGLSLFADEKYASNTVTSVSAPEALDVKKLLKLLREEHDIVLGGGQLHLSGKIFRIGHLGFVSEEDIKEVLNKLRIVLPQAGFEVTK
ncbi:MAG: alanine--glyoxylate aminotransferase family protein [Dehalococcoidales bacterium]|nr:alanine--glyoxylate aminotransferase family protein [Dehalococcoidales bacterium]